MTLSTLYLISTKISLIKKELLIFFVKSFAF